jgi:hypothetical protein
MFEKKIAVYSEKIMKHTTTRRGQNMSYWILKQTVLYMSFLSVLKDYVRQDHLHFFGLLYLLSLISCHNSEIMNPFRYLVARLERMISP